jgi:hypothetical protein
MDDVMRLFAGPFFADGCFGLFPAVFAGFFEAAFLAGAAEAACGGVSAGLEAVDVVDFLAAVLTAALAGVGAVPASDDCLPVVLPAVFLAAVPGVAEAGAGAASGFVVVPDDPFACELIFSAKDFFVEPAPWGTAADLAVFDVFDDAGDAEVAGAAASGAVCPDSRAEIRKSLSDAPRFFSPCLSQAGFGPRPLQV